MSRFQITKKEVFLGVVLGFMGYIFSQKSFYLFLNSLNPIQGLGIYYLILYSSLFILSKLGLTIFDIKIKKPLQVLGLVLITFAFFIVIDWTTPYTNIVTKGSIENVSTIFFQAEDGATWYFWNNIVGIVDLALLRILTFIISPFILAIIGGLLVDEKIEL